MAKLKTTFFCQNCGSQYSKWQGQCTACKEWNTIAEEIIENNGCLLSEYPIGFASFKNNFVERDRIESGLSLGTIVIEANVKSGTMHTANFTLEQERVLACLNKDKSGNKLLLENDKVVSINKEEDINKVKIQLEYVKKNLYKNKGYI